MFRAILKMVGYPILILNQNPLNRFFYDTQINNSNVNFIYIDVFYMCECFAFVCVCHHKQGDTSGQVFYKHLDPSCTN